MRFLITGASGFIGGHVAERCTQRGWPMHAIVRPQSDTGLLEKLGVRLFRGDLGDPQLVRQALADVDVVVHTAAKVGNWGPLEEYRQVNVELLRGLLEACKGLALARFIHVSSLGVYPLQHHYGSDETMALPDRHPDAYSQSKVEAEQLALRYYREFGVPVVVLRPGFVYGPRDRTVMPRILDNLRKGTVAYPGAKGQRALNTIFVRNLVDAIFLAVDCIAAVGQVYNVTDGEFVTKRRFMETVADALSLPRPTRQVPLWLARLATWSAEKIARWKGKTEAPLYNFATLKFMGYNLDFSIDKIRRDLGYRPRVAFEDGMYETMAWYKNEGSGVKGQGSGAGD